MNRILQRCAWFVLASLALFASQVISAKTGAENSPLPPVPAERADRFGIYNWGVDYAAYPGGALDRLNWAADRVASLGSRTIRVAMPGDIYQLPSPAGFKLAQVAASSAYDRLFADPRFKTYLLTAYSSGGLESNWADGFTPTEYQAEREEMRQLGEYLLGNPRYAGKTFILLNWEGDNAIEGLHNKQSSWDAYTAWIESHAEGVRAAREARSSSTARLFSALEFNRVRGRGGLPCGSPVADPQNQTPLLNRCVIDYVAPKVAVDYYSYSAWLSLDVKIPNEAASLKEALKTDLSFALGRVRAGRPEVGEANFLIGEYGFHRTRFGENRVANFVDEMFSALEAPDAFKVSYAIFWQIIDNASNYFVGEDGFGLYKSRQGELALSQGGVVFRQRLANQRVANYTDGPAIRKDSLAPGVLDALSNQPVYRLYPDSILSIYTPSREAGFSSQGNVVWFQQGARQFVVPRDNAAAFYESTLQINASLPLSRRPGKALVSVTNRDGVDSNAQMIKLDCEACPEISGVMDTGKYLGELHPGGLITLFGSRFSGRGNKVVIEQLDEQNVSQPTAFAPSEVLSEAPNRIDARLPLALRLYQYAIIHVTDRQDLTSNDYLIYITPECETCAPAIQAMNGIVNRDTQAGDFYPAAPVTITGTRFSSAGNKVIVEQGSQRYTMVPDGNWRESSERITGTLPSSLLPGLAQLYIVTAEGRESLAAELRIQRSSISPRPNSRRNVADRGLGPNR